MRRCDYPSPLLNGFVGLGSRPPEHVGEGFVSSSCASWSELPPRSHQRSVLAACYGASPQGAGEEVLQPSTHTTTVSRAAAATSARPTAAHCTGPTAGAARFPNSGEIVAARQRSPREERRGVLQRDESASGSNGGNAIAARNPRAGRRRRLGEATRGGEWVLPATTMSRAAAATSARPSAAHCTTPTAGAGRFPSSGGNGWRRRLLRRRQLFRLTVRANCSGEQFGPTVQVNSSGEQFR